MINRMIERDNVQRRQRHADRNLRVLRYLTGAALLGSTALAMYQAFAPRSAAPPFGPHGQCSAESYACTLNELACLNGSADCYPSGYSDCVATYAGKVTCQNLQTQFAALSSLLPAGESVKAHCQQAVLACLQSVHSGMQTWASYRRYGSR